ncbi:MAG: pilus assembly protein [Burkholderiales bacterium]|nr:pilus assembly protein [Burkholderiales bacterium]
MKWKDRIHASSIHLGISLLIACLAALLVFAVWYPYPYREISGGRELFLIVVAVDVVLGPLITLAIFDRGKPWRKLRLDLAVVGLVQLAGLSYGLWTVHAARPAHLVFEIDRFRVVHAIDIDPALLAKTPAGVEATPWTGPTLLGVRPFRNSNESMEATLAAVQGASLGARPDLWQTYDASRPDVIRLAKPLDDLLRRFPARAKEIETAARKSGLAADRTGYVPMVGRKEFWTPLVDRRNADVVGFVPIDSF